MIISVPKPLEEIKTSVASYKMLAIFGCGGCAAVCQAGGTKQVEELAESLKEKDVVFTFMIDEPCDRRILARELRRVAKRLERVEAAIVLACGTGVQAVAAALDKPCMTGLDTLFPGTVIHSSDYFENCSACGECLLNLTAAICPRTRCPKSILNGPCSEKIDERCSIDPDTECVWVSITNRLETLGLPAPKLDFSPLNLASQIMPRRMTKPKVQSGIAE